MSEMNMVGSRLAAQAKRFGLDDDCRDFLTCVMDPLFANSPAHVPDEACERSICLVDSFQRPVTTNNLAADCHGIIMGIYYWRTGLLDTYGGVPDSCYGIWYAFIDSAGTIGLPSTGGTKLTTLGGVNKAAIIGSATSYDEDQALVQSLRMFAAGLRVLPVVETVTDTTQIHVSYYIGAQVSSQEILRCISNGTDIETIMRSSPSSAVYGNNEGVTVRYNPFQTKEQLSVRELDSLAATEIYSNFDLLRMPTVMAMFSSGVAQDEQLPVRLSVQYWFEGQLQQPTPIYSTVSHSSPMYNEVQRLISNHREEFPLTTKGHSFSAAAAISILTTLISGGTELLRFFNQRKKPKKTRNRGNLGTRPQTGGQSTNVRNTRAAKKKRVKRRRRVQTRR
jgi:hypothetical protein